VDEFRKYSTLIGISLLAFIAIFLLSSPEYLYAAKCYVDTELRESYGSEKSITLLMDFGDDEYLRDFPLQIKEWTGVELETSDVKEMVGASAMISRTYAREMLSWPVFLVIMQSRNKASFHAPTSCYPVRGYGVEWNSEDSVFLTDTSWYMKGNLDVIRYNRGVSRKLEGTIHDGWIQVNKLIVAKMDNDEVVERRVVLYFFMDFPSNTGDRFNMVRVSTPAPESGPYDNELNMAKELMSEIVPLLFEPIRSEGEKMILMRIAGSGPGGYFIIFLLFSIPLAIIIYPRIVAKRKKASGTEKTGPSSIPDRPASNP